MRHKLKLLNLILIVVFSFSFAACTIPNTYNTTKKTAETAIPETTATQTLKEDVEAFNSFYENISKILKDLDKLDQTQNKLVNKNASRIELYNFFNQAKNVM
jgi:DNA-binding ferritin-like protein